MIYIIQSRQLSPYQLFGISIIFRNMEEYVEDKGGIIELIESRDLFQRKEPDSKCEKIKGKRNSRQGIEK